MNESVLKNRNFLLLFQGSLTSNIAANFYSFAISFYILEITGNNASMQGVYLFVCGLVYVLTSFVGGVLADRWNRVKIVYGSDFVKGVMILLSLIPLHFAIRNGTTSLQLAVLFVIGVVNNLLAAVFNPASTALIPAIVSENQLMQANALFSIQNSVISILGAVLASVLYAWLSIPALFAVIGVLYVVSGVTELFIRIPYTRKETRISLGAVFREFGEGFRYLWGMRAVFTVILAALFLNFFLTPISSNFLPYMIKTEVAGHDYLFRSFVEPEMWMAIISTAIGVGSVAMAMILSGRKQKEKVGNGIRRWIAIVTVLYAVLALIYCSLIEKNLNAVLISMTVGMFLIGIALININIPLSVVVQKQTRSDMLAKVTSLMNIGSMGLTPISSLLGGIILSALGTKMLLLLCVAGVALVSVLLFFSKKVPEI